MFSLIRLIDRSIVAGMLVLETEYEITIENAVLVGRTFQRGNIEASYFFTGMYNPFFTGEVSNTILEKRNVISFHSELDPDLESQYNKFINDWNTARKSFSKMSTRDVEKMLEETLERIDAMNESANTILH